MISSPEPNHPQFKRLRTICHSRCRLSTAASLSALIQGFRRFHSLGKQGEVLGDASEKGPEIL